METVEMDLMQAQIGSLATDVSRLEAKVNKGDTEIIVMRPSSPGVFTAWDFDTPIDADEFVEKASKGKIILKAIAEMGEGATVEAYATRCANVLFGGDILTIAFTAWLYSNNDIYQLITTGFSTSSHKVTGVSAIFAKIN